MAQAIKNRTNSGIRQQRKRSTVVDKKNAVILLFELTRSTVKFRCIPGILWRELLRRISAETFRDVATNSGRYQVDHSMVQLSAVGTERCGGNTPIETLFPAVSYADSWVEKKRVSVRDELLKY